MFLENEKIFLIENDRISSNKGDGKYVKLQDYGFLFKNKAFVV